MYMYAKNILLWERGIYIYEKKDTTAFVKYIILIIFYLTKWKWHNSCFVLSNTEMINFKLPSKITINLKNNIKNFQAESYSITHAHACLYIWKPMQKHTQWMKYSTISL